jgi:hypothetical protein
MKKISKFIFFLLLAALALKQQASAQNVENFRSLDIRYGRTGLPGDIFKLVSERYLAEKVNLALGGFWETSHRNLINYNSYGLDVMVYYYTPVGEQSSNRFQVRLGLGGTADYEQESELYKTLSIGQKINTGIVGEIAGEWAFTEDFSLLLAYNQKAMFVKQLGNYRYDISIGFKLKFF